MAAAVLAGRYSNGAVWAVSAKNSATGTEMYGGKVDESSLTIRDPQWGTQYSLQDGSVVGKWCPSPPVLGALIGTLFPPEGVWVPQVGSSPHPPCPRRRRRSLPHRGRIGAPTASCATASCAVR